MTKEQFITIQRSYYMGRTSEATYDKARADYLGAKNEGAAYVQANEDAYFDNFIQQNQI